MTSSKLSCIRGRWRARPPEGAARWGRPQGAHAPAVPPAFSMASQQPQSRRRLLCAPANNASLGRQAPTPPGDPLCAPRIAQAPRAGVGAGAQAWLVPAGSWGAARRFFLRVNPWERPGARRPPLLPSETAQERRSGAGRVLEPWPSPGASWGLLGRQFPPLDQRAHSNRKLRFQGFCRSIRLIERVFGSFYSTVRSDMQSWLAFSWPYNLLSDKVLRITVYSCANAPAGPTCRTLLLGGSAKP